MTAEVQLPQHVTVVRKPGQFSADIDGEAVILSIDAGQYYDLNPVASRIWALVEQPISVAALIDTLLREFEVERKTCEEEVLVFLRQLHADGLVQISEPCPPA